MNVDGKDILGLPRTPMSITQKKKSQPQKDSQRKPNEISCKVYALTGGLALLMPSIDVSQLKKCSPSGEKVNLKPQMPTKIVCAVHLQEILTHLNLQEQLQYKEAEGSSFLEGSYGNMPGTLPKQSNRGADQEERVLMCFD